MNERQQRGGSITLIVAVTVIIVLVGVGLFFIIQAMGGFRELQNATDSGNLNLARQAIKRPSIAFSPTNPVDQGLRSLGDPDVGGEINLLTYNRLIGQALLAALNAQAEGTPASQANVSQLFQRISGGPNSFAQQLFQALQGGSAGAHSNNNAGYDLKNQFGTIAGINSVRMNGNAANVGGAPVNSYRIGYYRSDNACTNIRLDGPNGLLNPDNRPKNFDTGNPVPLPGNASSNVAPDGHKYLRGYEAISFNFPAVGSLRLIGVPVQPGEQPHHISMRNYNDNAAALGLNGTIPPNALYSRARVNVHIGDQAPVDSITESVAVVGVMGQSFIPRFQDGYMIIDNTGSGSTDAFTPTGSSVLANELGSGIVVSGSYPNAIFSTNDVAMNAWSQYDHSGSPPAAPPANMPPTLDLFNTNGDQATWQECWNNIPHNSLPAICDDHNTDSSPCQQLIDPQGGHTQGPFDLAYHRNNNIGGNPAASEGLIADEVAKCRVWQAYYVPPFSACVNNVCATYFSNIPSTGLRLFPTGHVPWWGQSVPWCAPGAGFAQVPGNSFSVPTQQCQVTHDGTLKQLLDQSFSVGSYTYIKGSDPAETKGAGTAAEDRPPAKLRDFISNRLRQMKEGAGDADVNIVMNTTIKLGKRYFVYLSSSGSLVCNEAPPPQHEPNVTADGVLRRFIKSYDADELITNTQHDDCIHDHHFMTGNGAGKVYGHNTIALTPASGANRGLLGIIRLQNDCGCYMQPGLSGVLASSQPTGDFSLCNRD